MLNKKTISINKSYLLLPLSSVDTTCCWSQVDDLHRAVLYSVDTDTGLLTQSQLRYGASFIIFRKNPNPDFDLEILTGL